MNTKQRIENYKIHKLELKKQPLIGCNLQEIVDKVNELVIAHNSRLDSGECEGVCCFKCVGRLGGSRNEKITESIVKCKDCPCHTPPKTAGKAFMEGVTQNSEWESLIRNVWDTQMMREQHSGLESRIQETFTILRQQKEKSYEEGQKKGVKLSHWDNEKYKEVHNQALDKAVEEIDFLVLSMGDRDIFKIAKEFMVELKEKLIGLKNEH